MSGPYAGLNVVELGSGTALGYAGQVLADRGAGVVKIEPPEGDPARHVRAHAPGQSKLFQWLGRGKKSVVLDLQSRPARIVLHELVTGADVLITSYSRTGLVALSLDPDQLQEQAPRLILVLDSAFGERGPWAGQPVNDLVLQAASGMLAAEGKQLDDGAPAALTSCEIASMPSGVMIAMGVSGALFHRARTGKGQVVVVNELATALSLQGRIAINGPDVETRAAAVARLADQRAQGVPHAEIAAALVPPANALASAGAVYYRAFVTRDGAIFMGALSRPLRDKIRKALGVTFLLRDQPDYDPNDPDFLRQCAEFEAGVVGDMRLRTSAEWLDVLEAHGVPCGEVTFPEDLSTNAQALANGYLVEIDHAVDGPQTQVAPAVRFGCDPEPIIAPAPQLGADTGMVLTPATEES